MKYLMIVFLLPLGVFAQNCDDVPALNQKIVDLADAKLKKKVGTGECWDLAQYVLDETGADWDNFETYGELIDYKLDCIYPGDIIQFKNIKIEWEEDDLTYIETMGHHTAIVHEVKDKSTIILIHQNTGQHGRKVGLTTFHVDAIKKGTIKVYRPQEGS